MDIYWSAVVRFINKPDATVDATKLTQRLVKRMNTDVMLSIIPPAVIAPPKHIAHIISQIVSIIPDIPRVLISSLISAFPASKEVLPNKVIIPPFTSDRHPLSSSAISHNKSGWNMNAKTIANVAERNKVIIEGNFLAIIIAVKTGTISSHKEMSNFPFKACVNSTI